MTAPIVDAAGLRADGPGGFRALLAQADYRRIWLAQVLAQLADKFLMFSLLILAYRVSGANTQVAFTLLAYTVPAVVVGPVAGLLVDRWDKKRIMLWTNFLRAVLVALIPIVSLTPLRGETWPILAITIAFAAVGQLFAPAEAAAIPFVVSRPTLVTANSLFLATMVVTLVVGAPLAQVVSRVSLELPYAIAAALFILAGISIARIRTRLAVPLGSLPRSRGAVREFLAGLHEVRRDRVVGLAFVQMSVSILVMFMIFVLGPGYMSKVLHLAPEDAYAILAPAMVGIVITAVVLGQFAQHWRRERILVFALLAAGATLTVMALIPSAVAALHLVGGLLGFAVVFSLLFGFEFGFLLIPSLTLLMERADEEMRGRVFGLLNMVINGVTAIPVLAAGALADLYGVNTVLAGMGILLLVGGAASQVARRTGHLHVEG